LIKNIHGRDKINMKTIGIYTKDFALYYDILKVLKKRKIPYVSLSSMEHIPHRIGVILTSNSEIHDIKTSKVIAADAYESIDQAVDKALHILIGKTLYTQVSIGIDPGEKPGIAVVGDDILLQKKQVDSPEEVYETIRWILSEYPARECIIRIGHGSITIRNRIINSLIPLGVSIEIVDESKTSLDHPRSKRDVEAAAAIAMLKGGRVQRRLPFEPTKGEIRRIQEKSRILSEGRFTISKENAILVLKGEITLREAVEKEKSQKRL